MWKFYDFSVTQILREINFGETRSSKNAVYAILGALEFANLAILRAHIFAYLVNFSLQKSAKIQEIQNSEHLNLINWLTPILISRKI